MIPEQKKHKALQLLEYFLKQKKVTVKEIQRLAGLLNFLNKALYPGRVFTRRMYAKTTHKLNSLKPHHHINLDTEFKADCRVGLLFLGDEDHSNCYKPFIDILGSTDAEDVAFYTDSSANPKLGFGGILGEDKWFVGQ